MCRIQNSLPYWGRWRRSRRMRCSLSIFRLHICRSSSVPHTSRGRILQSKILKVAQPRLAKQEPRRSIFAFCASSTNVISISRHFRLRKAKCESSAHTHHTCLDFTFSSNLGLFSCEATKNTYVDFSVLAQGNILRCFFIIQIANYSRHISITSSTAKAVPLPQQGRLIKNKKPR